MQWLVDLLIIVAALVLTVWPGVWLVSWILQLATKKDRLALAEESGDELPEEFEAEVLRGGAWIGALERVSVTLSLIFGQPLLIPVVVAVKGLGRFSELKSSYASEKFVIGTLASLLWAGLIGALAIWLLSVLKI